MSEIKGLWIGPTLSKMEELSIRSFLRQGHSFALYAYSPIQNVPADVILRDANEILPESRIFAYSHGPEKGSLGAFANLFRLHLLHKKGGFWSDLDVVCLRHFDFHEDFVFSSERTLTRSVTKIHNGILKAPQGSPFLASCIASAEALDISKIRHGENGAKVLSEEIERFGLGNYVQSPSVFCPIDWWNTSEFINRSTNNQDFTGSFSIHLWGELWRRSQFSWVRNLLRLRPTLRKDHKYSSDCLYGRLQEQFL